MAGRRHPVRSAGPASYLVPHERHVRKVHDDLSSGLSVLVYAGKRLRRDDGKLLLRSAPPSVQRMIETIGLDATLTRI